MDRPSATNNNSRLHMSAAHERRKTSGLLLPPGLRETRSRFGSTPLEPIPGSPAEAANAEPSLPTLLGSNRGMQAGFARAAGLPPLKTTDPIASKLYTPPHTPGPIKSVRSTPPPAPASAPAFEASSTAVAAAAATTTPPAPVLAYEPPQPPAVLSYGPSQCTQLQRQAPSQIAGSMLPREILSYGPRGEPIQGQQSCQIPSSLPTTPVGATQTIGEEDGQEARRRRMVAEARQKELPLKVRVPSDLQSQTNPLVQMRLSVGLPVKKKPVYEEAGVTSLGGLCLDPSLPAKKAESPFLLREPVLVCA